MMDQSFQAKMVVLQRISTPNVQNHLYIPIQQGIDLLSLLQERAQVTQAILITHHLHIKRPQKRQGPFQRKLI